MKINDIKLTSPLQEIENDINTQNVDGWISVDGAEYLAMLEKDLAELVAKNSSIDYDSTEVPTQDDDPSEVELDFDNDEQVLRDMFSEDKASEAQLRGILPWKLKTSGDGDFYVQRIGNNVGRVSKERHGPTDIAVTTSMNPDYLFYVFQHLQPKMKAQTGGAAYQTITQQSIHRVLIKFFNHQGTDNS